MLKNVIQKIVNYHKYTILAQRSNSCNHFPIGFSNSSLIGVLSIREARKTLNASNKLLQPLQVVESGDQQQVHNQYLLGNIFRNQISMKINTYFFIIRIIIAYIFFIFGCYILDKQALFEVLLPNFNKAPESSFLFFIILLFITVSYIFKLYKIRRMK